MLCWSLLQYSRSVVDALIKLTVSNGTQVDPADVVMLIISYHFEAENSCEYTRQEFISGMTKLDCDSVSKLGSKLPILRKQLQESSKFQVHAYLLKLCIYLQDPGQMQHKQSAKSLSKLLL